MLAPTKPHPRAASVFVDEFYAGSFQRSTQCGFISPRYRNLPINDLCPTDGRHADF